MSKSKGGGKKLVPKKAAPGGTLLKYRDAVNYLRLYPGEKYPAYVSPGRHWASCLFQFCTPDGRARVLADGRQAGDPLMVARKPEAYGAWTVWIEQRALGMGLAGHPDDLTDRNLQDLAFLQRDMDESIRCPRWRLEHQGACVETWFADFNHENTQEIW